MTDIVIIDYGLGNLRSVTRGLEHAGAEVTISSDPAAMHRADAVVLPGVGAFQDAMLNLAPLTSDVLDVAATGKPMLGICLGMQMLLTRSEEGGMTDGLGMVPGNVVRFPSSVGKVPHMGWNSLNIKSDHPLFRNIPRDTYVYFVHSYFADCAPEYVLASCGYGIEFAAAVVNKAGNVMGTQFHPEKSGEQGLKMLENFVGMC
ncbi:MAG: imidazole glycerol phosphate synthase subunit HisH [ANME-2 cluster archaeon]|nr:imidazole glycerol phosphate synthase subunit HisH [ANME-2 cluster archaeon]MDW7777003.1 imidazole glycerol phosphate synthase subunit HisH [Methanosarcinales archaeon]